MEIFEISKNDFFISTDRTKLNVNVIHNYLSVESYWAKNIPLSAIERSIKNSFCFGLYKKEQYDLQIGFARAITDFATFAYLADVFILEEYRGQGLSKWLMETILNCEALQGLRSWMLATRDAHALYAQFGFTPLENPLRFMRLSLISTYPEIES